MDPLLTDLLKLRQLLTPPGSWIQGKYAADSRGNTRTSTSPEATCWCLEGAVSRATHGTSYAPDYGCHFQNLFRAVKKEIDSQFPYTSLISWNDHPSRSHSDVLTLIDGAIARRKESIGQ